MNAIIGQHDHQPFAISLNSLTRHAAIIGSTGSGKTVLCKVLIEEALLKHIPVIAIDPKGDIGGLGIHHPHFDFQPYVSPHKAKSIAYQYQKFHDLGPRFTHTTTIFTPNSDIGKRLSLMPNLSPPLPQTDNTIHSNQIAETTANALLEITRAPLTSTNQTLLTTLIIDQWNQNKTINITQLINNIITPPFDTIGGMNIEDMIPVKKRKQLASSINVLLSSPTKQSLISGNSLDIDKLLNKTLLTIIDMRHTHDMQDKQIATQHVLQQLYRHMIGMGGTHKLRAILYIDELSGLFPPHPASPLCKRLLELLIRQARAFGIGVVVATQNPGDIDYKVLSNIGTRFIGRLRSDNDIAKVASATQLAEKDLRKSINQLSVGSFIIHDATTNKTNLFTARHTFTYHAGPLTPQQVDWINHPELTPKTQNVLSTNTSTTISTTQDTSKNQTSKKQTSKKQTTPKRTNNTTPSTTLPQLIATAKRYSDEVSIKKQISNATHYDVYLRVVITPHPFHGITLPIQGPYLYNLATRSSYSYNYLSGIRFSQNITTHEQTTLKPAQITHVIHNAKTQASQTLKTTWFTSTLLPYGHGQRECVIEKNLTFLNVINKHIFEDIHKKYDSELARNEKKVQKLHATIRSIRAKIAIEASKRMFKKILRKPHQVSNIYKNMTLQVKKLTQEKKIVQKTIEKIKRTKQTKLIAAENKIQKKAKHAIRTRKFKLTKNNTIIHTTLLLVPAKN